MADLDKFIKLLGQTDGRDKLYKTLAGIVKVLAVYATTKDQAKIYGSLGKSIGEGRSIMRLAKWVGNVSKLQALVPKLATGFNVKTLVEVFRVLGDFGYICGDNIAYLSKYKVLGRDAAAVTKGAKLFQFYGYVFAVILDVFAIQAARAKAAADVATSRKEVKANAINLTKNVADLLVVTAAVGYVSSVWKPSNTTTGALTITSGAIATYQNWSKLK
jgi:hypothetical protein